MSVIYIVAVIVFAVLSTLGKSSRKKGGPPGRGGMPPFGQGGGSAPPGGPHPARGSGFPNPPGTPADRRVPAPARAGFPEPAASRPAEDRGASPFAPAPSPSPDYETGEGMSQEQPESLDDRIRSMQRELDRMHAAFDRIEQKPAANARPVRSGSSAPSSPSRSGRNDDGAERAGQLRQGLIWAEILGPPRSRRPHGGRPTR